MSHWISLHPSLIQSPLHCKQTQLISRDQWHTAGRWPFGGSVNRLSITQAICRWSVFPVNAIPGLAKACRWSLSHGENPYACTIYLATSLSAHHASSPGREPHLLVLSPREPTASCQGSLSLSHLEQVNRRPPQWLYTVPTWKSPTNTIPRLICPNREWGEPSGSR